MAGRSDAARKVSAPKISNTDEMDSISIDEFCRRNSISSQMYYKLKPLGLMPKTFRVGVRVLISKEAAAKWRRDRENEAQ